MPISFDILENQTKIAIPSGCVFRLYYRNWDDFRPIELNGAHFHPAIVSLPLHPFP